MSGITTMTKIIGITRMIGMTGDRDAKKTRMSRMTGLAVACSAGIFFEHAIFSRKCMLKLPKERKRWGKSKGEGRGRGERREKACPKTL